jgi:hypothetical protein
MARTGDYAFPDFNGFPATGSFPAGPPQLQTSQPLYAPSSIGSPQSGLTSPQTGEKRTADTLNDGQYVPNFEDASRLAAEEDKRRRNTAASARFRVKKKQREQALEKSAKEMSDKVAALEGRINQLETENKWLKNLIMEKNENKDDITALWKKYSQEVDQRKTSEGKDGVGTGKA